MSDTLPEACPFMVQNPCRPGRAGQGWPREGAMLSSASGWCGLWAEAALSHWKTSPGASKAGLQALLLSGSRCLPEGYPLSPPHAYSAPRPARNELWSGPHSGHLPLSLGAS